MNKAQSIRAYLKAHPDAKVTAIAKTLGIQVGYVYKVVDDAKGKKPLYVKKSKLGAFVPSVPKKVIPVVSPDRRLADAEMYRAIIGYLESRIEELTYKLMVARGGTSV
jgi:hypothetical protein